MVCHSRRINSEESCLNVAGEGWWRIGLLQLSGGTRGEEAE
jgi:hypothetical protein